MYILNLNSHPNPKKMTENLTTPTKKLHPPDPKLQFSPFKCSFMRSRATFLGQQSELSKIRTPDRGVQNSECMTKKMTFFKLGRQVDSQSASSKQRDDEREYENGVEISMIEELEGKRNIEEVMIGMEGLEKKYPFFMVINAKEEDGQSNESSSPRNRKANNKPNYHYKLLPPKPHPQNPNPNSSTSDPKPGDYLSLSHPLPESLLTLHKENQKSNPEITPHFIHGYLTNAHYLYYSLEKKLILCRPSGPLILSKMMGKQEEIVMELSSLLYNVVESGVGLAKFFKGRQSKDIIKLGGSEDNGQILIFCHPYQIQLYYLLTIPKSPNPQLWQSRNRKSPFNPLIKLNLKYSLPDCSMPKHILLFHSSFIYLPDKQFLVLKKVCLRTGVNEKISLQCSLPSSLIQSRNYYDGEDKDIRISAQFMKKVVTKITAPSMDSWFAQFSAKYLTKITTKILIKCCHNQLIITLQQIRPKTPISTLLNTFQTSTTHNYNRNRVVIRLYSHNTITQKWHYFQKEENSEKEIFCDVGVRGNCSNQECQCTVFIYVYDKVYGKLQMQEYRVEDRVSFRAIGVPFSIDLGPNVRSDQLIFCQQHSSEQNQLPICFKSGNSLFINPNHLTPNSKISSSGSTCGPIRLELPPRKHLQQYLHRNPRTKKLLLSTDTGYIHILQFTTLDWLYTFLYTYLTTTQQTTIQISQLCLHMFTKLPTSSNYSQLADIVSALGLLAIGSMGTQENIILIDRRDGNDDKDGKDGHLGTVRAVEYCVDNRIRDVAVELFGYVVDNMEGIAQKYCTEHPQTNNTNPKQQQQQKSPNSPNPFHINKLFPPLLYPVSPNQTHKDISTNLLKVSISTILASIFKQIWHKNIGSITYETLQKILADLDCFVEVGEMFRAVRIAIGDYEEKINLGHGDDDNKLTVSPVSTLAQSYSNANPSKHPLPPPIHSTHPTMLTKLTQLTITLQLIKTKNPSISFQDAYHASPSYFSPYLFQQFVEDYDDELLEQWCQLLPMFTVGVLSPEGNGDTSYERKDLGFWMGCFGQISGVTNRRKICKILSNRLEGYTLIKQPQLSTPTPTQSPKALVVPTFFTHYLHKHKKLQLQDIAIYEKQQKQLSEQSPSEFNSRHYVYDQNTWKGKDSRKGSNEKLNGRDIVEVAIWNVGEEEEETKSIRGQAKHNCNDNDNNNDNKDKFRETGKQMKTGKKQPPIELSKLLRKNAMEQSFENIFSPHK